MKPLFKNSGGGCTLSLSCFCRKILSQVASDDKNKRIIMHERLTSAILQWLEFLSKHFSTLAVCEGKGVVKILGETMETDATMNTKCDKCKWTCNTKWTFKHKQCPQTCNAETYTDYSRANRLAITTKYGGDKEMNNEFLVEKQGKTLRIVNTWNKVGYCGTCDHILFLIVGLFRHHSCVTDKQHCGVFLL